MTRHGRNCTAGAVYTYHEKQKDSKVSGWGSLKARFSKESIKDFDCCSLTLQPCKDPVVTKDGQLYDREAILEYIVHHKQLFQRKLKAYEKQLEKDSKEEKEISKSDQTKQVEKFINQEESITTKRENPFTVLEDDDETSRKKMKISDMSDSIINTNSAEKKNLPSFWIPSLTPQASTSRVEKPDNKVYCPMTNQPIRMKDLVKVKFTLAPVESTKKSLIARKERYICAVTRDILSNTVPCAVLRPTGDVITMAYVNEFIKKDWICPITGKTLKEKDIIELKRGGTGFSSVSGDALKGKAYGPTMMSG